MRVIEKAKANNDLVTTARKLMQRIREDLQKINAGFPNLIELSNTLEALDESAALVQLEEALHTAAVIKEIRHIIRATHYIAQESARMIVMQKIAVAKDGPEAPIPSIHRRCFANWPRCLTARRDSLERSILCAQVELTGNNEDGFYIQSDVLFEMSRKVQQVLGIDLILAMRLRDMTPPVTTGVVQSNECFPKEESGQKHGYTNDTLDEVKSDDIEQNLVYDNVTVDYARTIADDVRVQA